LKVFNDHFDIKKAANLLKINYNTAKTIVRTLKKENRIFKKKKVSKKDSKRPPSHNHTKAVHQNIPNNIEVYLFLNIYFR